MSAARLALVLVLLVLAGCERTFRDMYDQPRYKPLAASPLWPDGRSARSPPRGVVAYSQGAEAGTTSGRVGEISPGPSVGPMDALRDELRPDPATHAALTMPPLTRALLDRGRDRFDIFCAPCHSVAGDGDGMIARRGFPHPPSFHSDALRAASDLHLYAVITHGYGAMYSYSTRVEPPDRLAIVAYIRALQLSQHAPVDALSQEQRGRLPPVGAAAPAETAK